MNETAQMQSRREATVPQQNVATKLRNLAEPTYRDTYPDTVSRFSNEPTREPASRDTRDTTALSSGGKVSCNTPPHKTIFPEARLQVAVPQHLRPYKSGFKNFTKRPCNL